jgi:hypothetical protein
MLVLILVKRQDPVKVFSLVNILTVTTLVSSALSLWYQLLELESRIANQSGAFSFGSDRPYPPLPHLTLGFEKNHLPTGGNNAYIQCDRWQGQCAKGCSILMQHSYYALPKFVELAISSPDQ